MKITIHRGTHTIGGSCIEIGCDDHRIILDAGIPLMDENGKEISEQELGHPSVENQILPDVAGLYDCQDPSVDAVLISHAHLDHSGHMNHIHPEIPVFLSKGSRALLEIGNIFYPDKMKVKLKNCHCFEHWKPFYIGPFKVTSYLMDHSAYDACAFLIEANNKKIFYTGDFRGHGRKKVLLERLIKNPIKDLDCMLMEGTTLKGDHYLGLGDEQEVEKELYDIFLQQEDVSFVMASGSNIDRIVSLYKSTKSAKKIFVIDLYTYFVLKRLKTITPRLPPYKNDHIRLFYIQKHAQNIVDHFDKHLLYQFMNRKIEIDEIVRHRKDMVIKLPISAMNRITEKLMHDRPLNQVKLIFSMWPGYLDKNTYYKQFCDNHQIDLLKIHVSGHAYLNALKLLSQSFNPKKLVPIHTLSGDRFNEYFENVFRIDDGFSFSV